MVMSESDLLTLAGSQHGYFTTAQAEAAGISRRALFGRHRKGLLERTAFGLYRLPQFPPGPRDELYALQAIAPRATFSHETALQLFELSDVLPRTIHLTVAPESGFKPRTGVSIHRSRIQPDERILRDDLWLTSPRRTLIDCARIGTDAEQLVAALAEGRDRGLLTRDDLRGLALIYPYAGVLR
jgi:predicted transcriptional regulator of viral defense system